MNRVLLLSVCLILPSVGCMQFRAVGPLADPNEPKPQVAAEIVPDISDLPKFAEAPPPPAPIQLIATSDITAANQKEAVQKLTEEIELDRKATAQFPNYVNVSKVERR